MLKEWDLSKLPPKGHPDVAEFVYTLFDISRMEKERLNKPNTFLANYALYRGQQNNQRLYDGTKGALMNKKTMAPVNLYFANVERTVSNITARNPTGEVVDLDGYNDGSEQELTVALKKWWKDTNQQAKTRLSARTMEIYGITPEKPFYNKDARHPDIMVTDPFAFFPAPGNWDEIALEAPYCGFLYIDYVSAIEAEYKVKDIAADDAYTLLGTVREDYKPAVSSTNQTVGSYSDAKTMRGEQSTIQDKKVQRGIIIELWIRDNRMKRETTKEPIINDGMQAIDPITQQPLIQETIKDVPVYRDGIRKITISKTKDPSVKCGYVVLDDCENPNINPALETELAATTYPWGRLPIYHANSYKDNVSIWGFAAAEVTSDLIEKINKIVQKLIAWTINVMAPPLIIQQNCGITREMIESQSKKSGRAVFMPTIPNARIEYMPVPNLPSSFFNVLELVLKLYDRVYQIEDADRGVVPRGVVAASAIVALQERNAVLMQSKTASIDSLVEQRARWAIGLMQNFGTHTDYVNVSGEPRPFIGSNYAGRKFGYVVESGSTTPRTSLQVQELVMALSKMGLVSRRYVLETLNVPSWKEEVERGGEGQLDQALQILIEAGMPQEMAIQLKQQLMLPQGGPGDTKQSQPKPGTPRAQQGQVM